MQLIDGKLKLDWYKSKNKKGNIVVIFPGLMSKAYYSYVLEIIEEFTG